MTRKVWLLSLSILILLLGSFTAAAEEKPASLPQPEVISLEKCLEMAFKNSQQLKAVLKKVEIAEAGVREAGGGFWPLANYQVSDSKYEPSSMGTENSFRASVSITQSLYTGGRLTNGLNIAKTNLEMAREDERKIRQQITYNVKEAYYRVWLAEQMLKVSRSSFENLGHHVEQVKIFYKVGTSSKFDLLRAEVQRESLKPQLIKAENGLALAKLNLATFTGLEKDFQFIVSYDPTQLQLPEKYDYSVQSILDEASLNRPELRQIKQLTLLKEYKTKMAEAAYKPTLALVGSYNKTKSDISDESILSLTLNLSGLIFDGFATPARIDSATKDAELNEINEISLRDQFRFEVEQSLQILNESLETTRASQSNIGLTKESLRLTQARFDAGMATTMDIMDAQLALDQAQSSYYQGICSYLTALAKLDLVAGKE